MWQIKKLSVSPFNLSVSLFNFKKLSVSLFSHSESPDEVHSLPPVRRGGGRGKKSAAKSEGNVANLGGTVKWAKVGLASWKGPLSASALPPCQPLSPNPSFPLQAPHTLFRLQIGTSFKEVSAENCKLCGFSLIRNEWKSGQWILDGFWKQQFDSLSKEFA